MDEYWRNIPVETSRLLLSQAYKQSSSLNYKRGMARTLARFALLNIVTGNNDTGVTQAGMALDISRQEGYQSIEAAALSTLGFHFQMTNEYPKAISSYSKALEINRELGNKLSQLRGLNNLGAVYNTLNDAPNALKHFREANKLALELGDVETIATLLNNMARILDEKGDHEQALEDYEEVLRIHDSIGSTDNRFMILANIGRMHYELGDYRKAIRCMRGAIVHRPTAMIYDDKGFNLLVAGKIHLKLNQPDSALYYVRKSLEWLEETNKADDAIYGDAALLMGHVYMQKGEEVKAVEHYQQAFEIGSSKNMYTALEAAEILYKFYKSRSEFSRSLDYLEKVRVLNDTLFNEEKTSQIAGLMAQVEFDKERQLLASEKARNDLIHEQEIREERSWKILLLVSAIGLLIITILIYRSLVSKKRTNREILEKKKKIEEYSEELEATNNSLVELSQFKEGLISLVVHDMKTPLNAIMTLSESEKRSRRMNIINQSSHQMMNLVSNLLSIQRFEETEVVIERSVFMLRELIIQSCRQLWPIAQKRDIRLNIDVDDLICVNMDKELTMRIISNIYSNAIKCSSDKGIVNIRSYIEAEDRLVIEFQDFGVGIAPEQLPYIFDKFWKAPPEGQARRSSTGLGLTFCKMAVEAHEGVISVESVPGEGSTFTLRFPNSCLASEAMLDQGAGRESGEFTIGENEIRELSKYYKELIDLKVYEVGKINRVVLEIESKDFESRWKDEFLSSVYAGDQDRYGRLLEMIKTR